MGKRREPRMQAKLHVRIAGIDASGSPILLLVPTRNISRQGALLDGIQATLKVGEIVAITYKTSRARFRALPPMAADMYVAPPALKGSP